MRTGLVVLIQDAAARIVGHARALRAGGVGAELGTLEAGKRADLIVVDGDPLADVHALRKVVLVVAGGKAYDPAKLWRSVGFQP